MHNRFLSLARKCQYLIRLALTNMYLVKINILSHLCCIALVLVFPCYLLMATLGISLHLAEWIRNQSDCPNSAPGP